MSEKKEIKIKSFDQLPFKAMRKVSSLKDKSAEEQASLMIDVFFNYALPDDETRDIVDTMTLVEVMELIEEWSNDQDALK